MKQYLFSLVLLFFFFSCAKENSSDAITNIPSKNDEITSQYLFHDGETVLGDTIDIPYSVTNLKKAFEFLPAETKSGYSKEDIQPTHYYVKFTPKNEAELDILINIKGLMLSEVPLDREIAIGGTSYHDPALPLTQPTYQYTTLPISYWKELTDTLSVENEVLIEAYMPDYLEETKAFSDVNGLPDELYIPLLKKAYEISGNVYDFIPQTKGSSWNPTGNIMAYDNIVDDYVPVQNVVIRGTHLLKIKETTTDLDGNFKLASFKNPVNLKVVWEGNCWDVRDGNLGQAVYDGPKLSAGSWNLKIPSGQRPSINHAAVFRAARRVYMGYIIGLSRPDNSRREKLAYLDKDIDDGETNGDYNRQLGAGVWSDIRIAGKNSDGWRSPSEIFSTTCHELGHASHYTNAKKNYKNSEQRLLESWARFYQYICTIREYEELGVKSKLWTYDSKGRIWPDAQYNFQNLGYSGDYTPLFIDIYDDYNQRDFGQKYVNDVIHGFPVSSLEGVAYSNTSFAAIKQHFLGIVNTTGHSFGITEQSLNDLFSVYGL